MTIDQKTQQLLALVETARAQKCDAILGDARARAAALLRDAHDAARARMRAMFVEEREHRAARIAAAEANLETRRRIALQQRAAALLAAGWQKLPDALAARWNDADCRRAWVAGVAADARGVMPGSAWRVVHAPGWPETERSVLGSAFAASDSASLTFVEDASLHAGLKFVADGNVVDGTQIGLLADRAEIGAQFLALVETTP